MTQRVLLISVRPRFAHAILTGAKTVELRRRPVNAGPGTRIILYSSAPEMAVVGTAVLKGVEVSELDIAWRCHSGRLGLERHEFDAYLDGSRYAYLLHLTRVCRLDEPLHLHQLRQSGGFRPPQSFRYIAASDPRQLWDLLVVGVGDQVIPPAEPDVPHF